MLSPTPFREALPVEAGALDLFLERLPPVAAVFVLGLGNAQQPYLGRCANLQRRVKRMLRPATGPGRLLNLRGLAQELAWWPTGSSLQANLLLLELARTLFPDRYRRMLRLRFPTYLRILTANRFPRVLITQQPGDLSSAFGPFPYRSHAEDFAGRALDHFLLRRCDDDLEPHPSHPGCIYGEMNLCLRPCQAAIPDERYAEESTAFLEFLATRGESLRAPLCAQRDAASEAMDFEAAARIHKRLGKLDDCWRGTAGFLGILARLSGVAVVRGMGTDTVTLFPVLGARLRPPVSLPLAALQAKALRDALHPAFDAQPDEPEETERERLAVLTKWKHSTWCDGEWVGFDSPATLPTVRIANAARRVVSRSHGESPLPAPQSEAPSKVSQPAAASQEAPVESQEFPADDR